MANDESLVSRMIVLTDGVVGIAIKLLVLDIRLPEVIKEAGPGWQDLLSIREQVLSFVFHFLSAAKYIGSAIISLWFPKLAQYLWLLLIPLAMIPDKTGSEG